MHAGRVGGGLGRRGEASAAWLARGLTRWLVLGAGARVPRVVWRLGAACWLRRGLGLATWRGAESAWNARGAGWRGPGAARRGERGLASAGADAVACARRGGVCAVGAVAAWRGVLARLGPGFGGLARRSPCVGMHAGRGGGGVGRRGEASAGRLARGADALACARGGGVCGVGAVAAWRGEKVEPPLDEEWMEELLSAVADCGKKYVSVIGIDRHS